MVTTVIDTSIEKTATNVRFFFTGNPSLKTLFGHEIGRHNAPPL